MSAHWREYKKYGTSSVAANEHDAEFSASKPLLIEWKVLPMTSYERKNHEDNMHSILVTIQNCSDISIVYCIKSGLLFQSECIRYAAVDVNTSGDYFHDTGKKNKVYLNIGIQCEKEQIHDCFKRAWEDSVQKYQQWLESLSYLENGADEKVDDDPPEEAMEEEEKINDTEREGLKDMIDDTSQNNAQLDAYLHKYPSLAEKFMCDVCGWVFYLTFRGKIVEPQELHELLKEAYCKPMDKAEEILQRPQEALKTSSRFCMQCDLRNRNGYKFRLVSCDENGQFIKCVHSLS